ncbi:MAG TPA: hypothetical protein VFX98_09915 [Longimicrobiaceae bacterium]|nr:hypothetical protein [Longimicrobiaceae bacterium]
MEGLTESLASARRISYTLVAVASALIVFVRTPDTTVRYQAALDEVRALRNLPLAEMHNTLVEQARDTILKLRQRRPTDDLLKILFNLASNNARLMTLSGASPRSTHFIPFATIDSFPVNQTLGVIDTFVRRNPNVALIEPAAFIGTAGDSLIRALRPGCHGTPALWICQFQEISAQYVAPGFTLELQTDERIVLRFSESRTTLGNLSVLSWLHAVDSAGLVVDTVDGRPVFLRASRAVWTEVKDLTLEEAEAVLAEKVSASRQRVSVLGLSLDERFAALAGPLLLAAILFYLTLVARHLGSMFNERTAAMFRSYPWFPLFPGASSVVFTILLILTLPCVAAGMVMKRFWDNDGGATHVLGILSGVFLLISTIACGSTLLRLRQSVAPAPPIPPAPALPSDDQGAEAHAKRL